MSRPELLALFAYAWWGLVPIYWKVLRAFPAEELILFRIVLSVATLLPLYLALPRVSLLARQPKRVALGLLATSLLIGFNWYLYVWAVNHDHVVESSLGYFINPLVNVALGTLLLGEKMRPAQKLASGLAGLGVAWLTWQTGQLPWIAVLLALSFAFYGYLRKILHLPTIQATFWESLVLALPALGALWFLQSAGKAHAFTAPWTELALLSVCGLVTTVPLLTFAEAAKHLPFVTLGLFQFLSPSLQFLLGVFLYGEPFGAGQWLAFGLIWTGLGIFARDLWRHRPRRAAQ